jgi:oxygen-independent coproporphyrinogen-3 oxidase
VRADVIERLMCDFEVDLDVVCARHGASASALIEASDGLTELAREGLVQIDAARIRILEQARPLVRVVASAFDAHLRADRAFSRAV